MCLQVDALPFPPRKFFVKNSETVAKQRRRQLEVNVVHVVV
jgi:hypothetical protein